MIKPAHKRGLLPNGIEYRNNLQLAICFTILKGRGIFYTYNVEKKSSQ